MIRHGPFFTYLLNLILVLFWYQDCVETYIKCVLKTYHILQYNCIARRQLHLRLPLLNLTLATKYY